MNKTIITVSREFGSGGRSVAKLVAETLGIPYYDKELIKQVAEKTGLSAEYVEMQENMLQEKRSFPIFRP